ncbi:putative metal-dependent hydrolase [Flammeovirga sp. MY04]|uniref:YfiT family bacillithiol transferase n=1 Tax=Flammeovirga sp. MY04 TaxID=1191459 RepID=UPI000806252F|nr:putative metal-dependent hydrolase [Flammeovirga sp. MY04]ANQ51039.1 putative metal-dependent hydrolase [Flammeovirga sp. MY04]
MTIDTNLQFPIGECPTSFDITSENISNWIHVIERFPNAIEELIKDISIDQLNATYRPGGWTVKQVIHHCADSHMNSFIRFKLALTEDTPTIRPYFEDRWAELSDSLDNDVDSSLLLLKALHKKWVVLLKSLNDEDLKRAFLHPEHGQKISLGENIGIYAWHCEHHLGHVRLGVVGSR